MKRIFILFILLTLLVACIGASDREPELLNRTTGWNPSVFDYEILSIRELLPNDPVFGSFVFDGSQINEESPIYVNSSQDEEKVLKSALQMAFQERYINKGTSPVEIIHQGPYGLKYDLYIGGETCAIIEPETGRIVQCVDIRIQKHLQDTTIENFRQGSLRVTVDLAQLSEKDLELYSSFARNVADDTLPKYYFDPNIISDVNEVYKSVKKILYHRYLSGALKNVGNTWIVYDADKSNCWLIVSDKFILLLDKGTGESKLFVVFLHEHCKDLSRPLGTQ